MTSWREFEQAAPELAAAVRAAFAVRKHATMATLRADGSPRISGTEVDFADDGEMRLGSMVGARKAMDLRRDPRVAVHSPSLDAVEGDEKSWAGEAKVAGRAIEDGDLDPDPVEGSHAFRIDLEEVVHTRLTPEADGLLIRSWHPDRGYQERRRA